MLVIRLDTGLTDPACGQMDICVRVAPTAAISPGLVPVVFVGSSSRPKYKSAAMNGARQEG